MSVVVNRLEQNPLITPKDIQPSQAGLVIECVMNPGAFSFEGKTWLLLRVAERPEQKEGLISLPVMQEDGSLKILEFDADDPDVDASDPRHVIHQGADYLSTISHLRLVCSNDGIQFKEPDDRPATILGQGNLETFGIEDCRVSFLEDVYYLTYTQVSYNGVGVGLMSTENWIDISRKGMILPPHNKDCALFEEKIGDKYYCFHRPSGVGGLGGNYLWVATSDNLTHWGEHQCILHGRKDSWDCAKVGAGAAPIRTSEGWLAIYHGADHENRYCLGAILLDLNDPTKILARSKDPIFEPVEEYEKTGFFGNVVFTNGHLVNDDEIMLYYGAADEVICGAKFSIDNILENL